MILKNYFIILKKKTLLRIISKHVFNFFFLNQNKLRTTLFKIESWKVSRKIQQPKRRTRIMMIGFQTNFKKKWDEKDELIHNPL